MISHRWKNIIMYRFWPEFLRNKYSNFFDLLNILNCEPGFDKYFTCSIWIFDFAPLCLEWRNSACPGRCYLPNLGSQQLGGQVKSLNICCAKTSTCVILCAYLQNPLNNNFPAYLPTLILCHVCILRYSWLIHL